MNSGWWRSRGGFTLSVVVASELWHHYVSQVGDKPPSSSCPHCPVQACSAHTYYTDTLASATGWRLCVYGQNRREITSSLTSRQLPSPDVSAINTRHNIPNTQSKARFSSSLATTSAGHRASTAQDIRSIQYSYKPKEL